MPVSGFPYKTFARGWYQVGWSKEFEPGTVRPGKYFEKDVVIYRANSGKMVVLDAHCRHMGAHLGYGGTVAGDDIVCPFHAWKWNDKGKNIEIPYSKQECVNATLRSWPVIEKGGLVLIWYHPENQQPDFEPNEVPEFSDPDYYPVYPHGATKDVVSFPPQLLSENGIDWPHLKYVHHWDAGDFGCESYEDRGNSFHIKIFGAIKTNRGVAQIRSVMTKWGVGLNYAKLSGLRDYGFAIGMTPIDQTHTEIRLSSAVKRKAGDTSDVPDKFATALHGGQITEILTEKFGGDRLIWEHLAYQTKPLLVPEEAAGTHALRRWMDKFYQDARFPAKAQG